MGFAPFGKVASGMEVVDGLFGDYGEGAPQGMGPNQGRMQTEGNAYLARDFPNLDLHRRSKHRSLERRLPEHPEHRPLRRLKPLASVQSMLPRLPVVLGLASLAGFPALGFGCSSSNKRDQNFGTDAGTDFQIPTPPTSPANRATQPMQPDTEADAGAADVAPDTRWRPAR